MKKLGDFKRVIWVVGCMLLITSCEQPDGEAEFINTNEEESFVNINATPKSNDLYHTRKEDTLGIPIIKK